MNALSKILSSRLWIGFGIYALMLKLLSLSGSYFLPQSGITKSLATSIDRPYYQVRLDQSFEVKKAAPPPPPPKPVVVETFPINNLTLKAIYGNANDKQGAFIALTKRGDSKIEILQMGDKIEYYTFNDIDFLAKEAFFISSNDNQTYTLSLTDKKTPIAYAPPQAPAPIAASASAPSTNAQPILAVPRQEIFKYRKDFKSIWKNISIREVVKNGQIEGFRIGHIKLGTVFANLGLRAGDVIKSVNNNPLKSYADAFKVYNNIDNIQTLKLTVIRQGQEKELEYEVY